MEYKEYLVEVNGQKNFSVPFVPYQERVFFDSITLEEVVEKLHEKQLIGKKEEVLASKRFENQAAKADYRIAMKISKKYVVGI